MFKLSCGPCDALMLKKASGTGKIYIRPLQQNLELKKVMENDDEWQGPFEKCLKCSNNIAMKNLEDHLKTHEVSAIFHKEIAANILHAFKQLLISSDYAFFTLKALCILVHFFSIDFMEI